MADYLHPDGVPPVGGPYSPGVRVGNLLFCAGQVPFNEKGELVSTDIKVQVTKALENLEVVCQAAGTSLKNAVKINAYLSSLNLFAAFNEAYGEFFGDARPARTTVPVDLRGFDVEIDAVVEIPETGAIQN